MSKIKAFIFDVGGVFRDSSKAINFALKEAFEKYGLSFPFSPSETWHLMAFKEFNDFPQLAEALFYIIRDNRSVEEILDRNNPVSFVNSLKKKYTCDQEFLDKLSGHVKSIFYRSKHLMKTIEPSVRGAKVLHRKGYKIGAVTVTKAEFTRKWLEENVGDFFEVVIGEAYADKAGGIVKACKHINIPPKESAFVGDTEIDIRSAKKAGCVSIAVLCGMGTKRFLEKENPDYIFRDVSEIAGYFRSVR